MRLNNQENQRNVSLEDSEKEAEFAVRKREKTVMFETNLVSDPMNSHLITESEKQIIFKCRFVKTQTNKHKKTQTGGLTHYQEYLKKNNSHNLVNYHSD